MVDKPTPVQVGTDTDWASVSAGNNFTLTLKTDGTIWAFGNGNEGQLGLGDRSSWNIPRKIGLDNDWEEFSAGTAHSVARKTDGTLWVWGDNQNGLLGDQATLDCTVASISNPVGDYTINFYDSYGDGWNNAAIRVFLDGVSTDYTLNDGSVGSQVVSIAAGPASLSFEFVSGDWDSEASFTIVAPSAITIASGGPNPAVGPITLYTCPGGSESIIYRVIPTLLNNDTDWIDVSAGENYTLAVKSNGTLWGWGLNNNGEVGDGTSTQVSIPTRLGTDTNWQAVSAGVGAAETHSHAIKTNGTLWSWGKNSWGQLGTEGTTSEYQPKQAGTDTDWAFVSVGVDHSVGIKSDGSFLGWGSNSSGQLGDGSPISIKQPTLIGTSTLWEETFAGLFGLGKMIDGTLWSWGYNFWGRLGLGLTEGEARNSPTQIGTDTDWVKVSVKRYHTLAIKSDGTLWAWGGNNSGQVGDGTTENKSAPVQIGTDNDWSDVITSHYSSYALKANGTLWAWGSNGDGQLGDGSTVNVNFPVQIGTDNDWASLSGGYAHVVAIKSNGTAWAWGSNNYGELGDGSTSDSSSPKQVGSSNDWEKIEAGDGYTMALKTDGTMWAWGLNSFGKLGDGSTVNRTLPVQIGTATDWAYISPGWTHTLALKNNGTLWAWGANFSGQLGDGTTINKLEPIQIGFESDWTGVSSGSSCSFAIKSNGTAWSWGYGAAGRLGQGTAFQELPVQVNFPSDQMVVHYPFNGNAVDHSWNGNDGIIQGAFPTSDRFGNLYSAYRFNGTDNYINAPVLPVSDHFTSSVWFRTSPNFSSTYSVILDIEGYLGLAVVDLDVTRALLNQDGTNYAVIDGTSYVADAAWHHGAISYDGTELKLYIDGKLEASVVTTDTKVLPDFNLRLGGNAQGASWHGDLDELRLYSNSLSEAEIGEIYNEFAQINVFEFPSQTGPATFDYANRTIDIEVAHGVDLHALTANFTLSTGATVTLADESALVSGGTELNYTFPVPINVTSIDGVVREWTINVSQNHPTPIHFEKVMTGPVATDLHVSAGASWVDTDGDSFPELYINGYSPSNRLYRNNKDGTFTDISSNIDQSNQEGTWVDFDNDGDYDLNITSDLDGDVKSFRINSGSGTFNKTILTVPSPPVAGVLQFNSIFGDYDNDGDLDVVYLAESDANPFFENNGDGTFTQNSTAVIATDVTTSIDASWVDIDNDGDQDFFVTNNAANTNSLYINQGNKTFTKVTTGNIVTDVGNSESQSWADIDHNGFLDVFVGGNDSPSFIYMNNGDGTFTKRTNLGGGIVSGVTLGSSFADYDNDGDDDLFIFFSSTTQPHRIFQNDGDGTFTEITGTLLNEVGISWSGAWGDYDRNGFQDLVVVNLGFENSLFKNTGNGNNWLNIKLEGSESNRKGVGARVLVTAKLDGTNAVVQTKQLQVTSGLRAQNEMVLHFGLGAAANADFVEVFWPSGKYKKFDAVTSNQFITISEVSSDVAFTDFTIPGFPAPTLDIVNRTIVYNVPSGTAVSALVPTFTVAAGAVVKVAGITQTSGTTSNDFTNPIAYTVTAEDNVTVQTWNVSVNVGKNTATAIAAFSLAEQTGDATIDAAAHTIAVTVPYGTDRTALVPTFTLSPGATAKVGTVAQVSGTTTNDFTAAVTYDVLAEDGVTTQGWIVTVTPEKNTAAAITAFSLPAQSGVAAIDATAHTVAITVPFGTDVTALVPTFELSPGATTTVATVAQVSGTTANNFTAAVTYDVLAEDGVRTQAWVVTVTVSKNPAAVITAFSFVEQTGPAVFDVPTRAITVQVQSSSNIAALVATFSLSSGASAAIGGTAQVSGTTANDFSADVVYKVTAEDGVTNADWVIKVTKAAIPPSTEAAITAFSLPEQSAAATIDATAHTVGITVVSGTDLTSLVPTFTLSPGASATVGTTAQVSGTTANDFTNPVVYLVKAEDGVTVIDWTVTVTVEGAADSVNPTITITSPSSYIIGSGGYIAEANYSDNIGVTLIELFVKKGKDTEFAVVSETLTLDGSKVSHPFGDGDFDELGFQFYFIAHDAAGNSTTTPTSSVAVEFAENSESLSGLTFGADEAKYQIIALPYQQVPVSQVFSTLMPYNKQEWRLYSYENSAFNEYPSFSNFNPGKGYWFLTKDKGNFNLGNVKAVEADATNPMVIELAAGWNMIGNPYFSTLDWSDVIDRNISNGNIVAEDLQTELFVYKSGWNAATTLKKYEGAIIKTGKALTLELPVSGNGSGRMADTNERTQADLGSTTWEVPINIVTNDFNYGLFGVGFHPEAVDGEDAHDWATPPMPGNFFQLQYEGDVERHLSKNIVPFSETREWKFDIGTTRKGAEFAFEWGNVDIDQHGYELVLIDYASMSFTEMATSTSYQFKSSGNNKFSILYMGTSEWESLKDHLNSKLVTVYPNPFKGAVNIEVTVGALDQANEADFELISLAGARVATKTGIPLTDGLQTITWQELESLPLSAGVYILNVTLRNNDFSTIESKLLIYGKGN